MIQLKWGSGIGLNFHDYEDYYLCLGYIANEDHNVVVYTHSNDQSGAWSGQGKLHNKNNIRNLPKSLQRSFAESGDDRLSVSSYVSNLVNNHAFSVFKDPTGKEYTYYIYPESISAVLSTVPDLYHKAFMIGYNM